MNRGLTVVASLRSIVNRDLTEEELFRAQVLGWCIEWVGADTARTEFFLLTYLDN